MKRLPIWTLLMVMLLLMPLSLQAQIPTDLWSGSIAGIGKIHDADVGADGTVYILTDGRMLTVEQRQDGLPTMGEVTLAAQWFDDSDESIFFEPSLAVGDNGQYIIASNRYSKLYLWQHVSGAPLGSVLQGTLDIWSTWPIDIEYAGDGSYYLLARASGPGFEGTGYRLLRFTSSENLFFDALVHSETGAYPNALAVAPDGGCIVAGFTETQSIWFGRVGEDGHLIWEYDSTDDVPFIDDIYDLTTNLHALNDGSFLFVGTRRHDSIAAIHLTADGNLLSAWEHDISDYDLNARFGGAAVLNQGRGILASFRTDVSGLDDTILLNLSLTDGSRQWERPVRDTNIHATEYPRQIVISPTMGPVVINRVRQKGPHGSEETSAHATVLDLDTPRLVSLWRTGVSGLTQISVGANGGTFDLDLELENRGPAITRDVWVQAVDADPGYAVEIARNLNVTIANGPHPIALQQTVPAHVPAGYYEYAILIGDYPWRVETEMRATLHKQPGQGDQPGGMLNSEGWAISGDLFGGVDTPDAGLPSHYSLQPVQPNPFNPTAMVSVTLPAAGPLTVTVHDLTGRQVATLLSDQPVAAGVHEFVLNGRSLASGVYFVRALVPGHLDQVRKAVLVK